MALKLTKQSLLPLNATTQDNVKVRVHSVGNIIIVLGLSCVFSLSLDLLFFGFSLEFWLPWLPF